MTTKPPKQSFLLPEDVRAELAAASRIRDPMQRHRAVQAATERAQRCCPQLYQTLSQPALKKE